MDKNKKRLIVTVINIVIFVGNAIISFLGNGGDIETVAKTFSTVSGAFLTGTVIG